MAVEARYLNCLPPQIIGNREIMHPIEGNTTIYNSMVGYGMPLSGTTTAESLLPAYNSVIVDSFPPKTVAGPMKSDSGITYNIPLTRKRSRDSVTPFLSYPVPQTPKTCGSFSFLGEDITLQIQKQQMDIDNLISQHMEKVRLEIEEKRKRHARRILGAIEFGMAKRLRAKEEEIEKIGNLNWALEERVKSLCVENQIWRELAQTNEATVNALRTNLEQVLAQVKEDRRINEAATALLDDAESCCGSNGGEEDDIGVDNGWRVIGGCGEEKKCSSSSNSSRLCKNCGKDESCVLILPCRHLCLCTVCGSSVHSCPICKSTKNTTVRVNMS